jgi:hypothetical protein
MVTRGIFAAALALMMSVCLPLYAAEVDMTEVRRLAQQPVETIFAGAPIGRISDATYAKTVNGSKKPVVVVFYANQDQQSRHLATLVRYLALEFGDVVAFYGYAASEGATIDHNALASLQKKYGLKKIPATLFYDNDKGKMELEKSDYSVPTVTEYRTPSPLFWNTYYQTTRKYIRENILD